MVEYWKNGRKECWNNGIVGMMEYWVNGIMEWWKIGIMG